MDIILKVFKIRVLQSRSYMYVAACGVPFTRAHLYTNVLFFFYVIIFLFVLSLFVILMINIDIHIPRLLSLTLVLLVRTKRSI